MIAGRIRQARELLGWSQVELAERAGIPAPQLSQYQNGAKNPSSETLAAIAAATGFDEKWLRRPEPTTFPEGSTRFRRRAAATKRDSSQIRRRLEVVYELVEDVAPQLRLPSVRIPMQDGPANDAAVHAAAAATREALGIAPSGPVQHLIRAAERSGVVVLRLPIGLDGHDGASVWRDPDERPVLGSRSDLPGDRQRFTVAHELGHLVCHSRRMDDSADAEGQANVFAGALLMPPSDAEEALADPVTLTTLAQLKAHWGISVQALIENGHRLGLIDGPRRRSLYQQLSARGWRRREPVEVEQEVPRLFDQILGQVYGTPLPLRRVADHYGLPPHLLREFIGGEAPAADGALLAFGDRQSRAEAKARNLKEG